jgi:hypothetical protein
VDTSFWLALIGVGVVLIVGAFVSDRVMRRRARRALQDASVPQDDRRDGRDDRDVTERDLQRRLERRNVIQLHDIDARRHDAIRNEWIVVQIGFVDDPTRAITRASHLVRRAMTARGYADENAFAQIDLIERDHPDLAPELRRAHHAAARSRAGDVDTEEMRRALLSYRAVCERLLDSGPVADVSHR